MIKNSKCALLTLLLVVFCFGSVFSQIQTESKKTAKIIELLNLLGGDKVVNEIVDISMQSQKAQLSKVMESTIEREQLFSAEEKEILKKEIAGTMDRMSARFKDFFTKQVKLDQLLQETMVPIYEKNFTEQEINDLLLFYRSETGKKTVELMPKLMMESMMTLSEKLMPKMTEFITEMTDSETKALQEKIARSRAKRSGTE